MDLQRDSQETIVVLSDLTIRLTDEELLKQPLQTQVSLSTGELDDFNFHERVHILLALRDLKVNFSE
jgi:hypothetical protein